MSEIETLAQSKHFEEYLQQLGYRKVVFCNDCRHKTKCYSDVVMIDKSRTADIYESIEWCSLGEREKQNV